MRLYMRDVVTLVVEFWLNVPTTQGLSQSENLPAKMCFTYILEMNNLIYVLLLLLYCNYSLYLPLFCTSGTLR